MATDIHVRFAEEGDSEDLWHWRNDPETRANSFKTDPIPWEGHKQWFAAAIKDPRRNIFIGIGAAGEKVGMVRFDQDPTQGTVEVNIVIAPEERGKGYGRTLVVRACEAFFQNFDYSFIVAKIKHENAASVRAFEKAGFVPAGEEGGHLVMHLRRPQ